MSRIKTMARVVRRCLRAALAGSLLCGGSVLAVVIGGSLPASAQPAVSLYVVSGGAGTGDCSSLANASASIQTAITTAEAGTDNGDDVTINVAAGTYTENDSIAATSLNSLTIVGAGASTTTVNGNQTGSVFTINSGTVTIDDVTITNGTSSSDDGDGIDINAGTVNVTDSTLSDNGTTSGGEGGGIYNFGGTVNVTGSLFSGNSAYFGGAITTNGGTTTTVTDSTLSGNNSSNGAGIDNIGTLTLTDSTLSGNVGDGIVNSGMATVTDSTLSNNSGGTGGAFQNNYGGTLTVTDSTLSDNSASYVGGGIANEGGSTLTVTDSTLTGNSAPSGNGGGIYNTGATVNLGATIVANSDSSGGDCTGTIIDEGYNIDSDGTCGLSATGSISDSPTLNASLGTLQNNGGPTETVLPTLGSPVTGVIPSSPPTMVNGDQVCPRTDQRGVASSGNCTIGAVEGGVVTLYVVSGGAGTGDCSSLANACGSIQTAITTAEGGSYNGEKVTINVAASPIAYTEDDTINASSLNSLTIAGAGTSSTAVNGDQNGTVFTVSSGTVTISRLTITNGGGQNAGYGGGIDNNGTLTVTDSTVSDNNSLYFGGGIWNTGTLTVTGGTLSGNTTAAFGGGIDNNGGTLTVTDSTLSGNSAGDQAGGIKTDSGTVTVTNSTLSGNSATLGGSIGGGIESYQSSTTVLDSTLSGNGAASGGNIQYQSGTLYLGATILAESTSGNDCAGGGVTDEGYNIADDASCGFTATGSVNSSPTLDADLGPLQNNGGPTDTMALLPGSPAIDQVTSGSGLCPATDQRGAPRTAPCDVGAYDTDWGPAVEVDISGTQDFGGSATLSYTTNAPGGIVSGTLTCATVDDGTPISSALAVGSYTVDGSSCSGLTSSNQADYPIFPSSYTGVTNGFAVPDITSVSFGGSVTSPTVTVAGVGFGTLANLGTAQSSCGTGSDYAGNLFLTDTTKTWSAGQGSDCIGLIIDSYTPTDIVFTFGSIYGLGGNVLTGGDHYTMNMLGSTFSGTDTFYAYPVVSEVSPDTGFTTGTTPVTITGTGFTGVTAVDFGGVAATNVTVVNDTTITADSPPGSAGPPVDVTVTGPGGLSAFSPADQYTYTVDQTTPQTKTSAPTCPTNTLSSPLNQTIVSVAGPAAPQNNATTSLTVNTDTLNCGTSKTKNYDYPAAVSTLAAQGFAKKAALTVTETVGNEPSTAGVQVCFGTGPNPTTGKFLKPCKASMKAPCLKSLTESNGSVLATFLSPATDPRFWTGNAAADLSSFSPAKGVPGATVTIKGTNLNGVVAVVIGGAKATISTASTAAKLVVTVPEKATVGTALITITSASGQAVSIKKFTVT